MFVEFPEVLKPCDVMKALGIGKNAVYSLLSSNKLKSKKIGKKYLIPKSYLINYIYSA